jgi:hypothetical protein
MIQTNPVIRTQVVTVNALTTQIAEYIRLSGDADLGILQASRMNKCTIKYICTFRI